uniref:Uncharacterized protein n=1 Tax=Meloidogyne enterolobii TaxID=390850 RepID=A0A6V7WEW4_MELEN|nr:unnamed protein product [Meloidogyne enterolobii]
MKFKKPSKKYSNFSCFLILLGIFIADSFVKADPFKLGEKDFPYQKLEKVDEQAIDKEKESFQIIANKIEEIKKEASGIGNLDKFEENALPVIEILTDDNKQKIYINEIGKINKLDGQIPTFFKDALKFEEFVKHFNNRFQIVNNDSEKKTSKTMKQKFQKLHGYLETLEENDFLIFLQKTEMCDITSSLHKTFKNNKEFVKYLKKLCDAYKKLLTFYTLSLNI